MSARRVEEFGCDFCPARGEGTADYEGSSIVYLPRGWTSVELDAGQSAEKMVFHLCEGGHETLTLADFRRKREARRAATRSATPYSRRP